MYASYIHLLPFNSYLFITSKNRVYKSQLMLSIVTHTVFAWFSYLAFAQGYTRIRFWIYFRFLFYLFLIPFFLANVFFL
jgi:hypothetical protein